MASSGDERRTDLLLQLQDRTGSFVNLIDGEVGAMLAGDALNNTQRRWLRTLRIDAMQGILWAIQQEDVVDSKIETLFFARMLHELKSAQAQRVLPAAEAAAVESMLTRADAIFWSPVEHLLGPWGNRIAQAASQYAAEHDRSPSVGFASSDLYVVVDDTAHRQLGGMFGLDARLAAAAKGVGHLNRTAARGVFLAEFAPLLLTRYAESASADLVDGVLAGGAGDLASLPARLEDLVDHLTSTLQDQQQAMSASLDSASDGLRDTLQKLDADLSLRIKDIDLAIDRQIQAIGGRIDDLNATAQALRDAVSRLEADVEGLASGVDGLARAIEQAPETVLQTLADPPATAQSAVQDFESRLRLNITLAIAGTMAGCIVVCGVMMWMWRRITAG
ncbi:MAG: hypothetical protein QF733_09615 [Phycisphaerales bacterium]|jgi:methyl-accepting chemotaxis protein|nr:hypothetical protein [Phycisphaerales bacterium]